MMEGEPIYQTPAAMLTGLRGSRARRCKLRAVDVVGLWDDFASPTTPAAFEPGAASALARDPALDALEGLELRSTERDALDVVSSARLGRLVELHLHDCASVALVRTLRANTHLTALRRVEVRGGYFGDEGARLLAESRLPLEVLAFASVGVTADGASAIATRTGLPALRELGLSQCAVGALGARALSSTPLTARLERLALVHAHLGVEGARALGASSYCQAALEVSLLDVHPAGLEALLASPSLRGLTVVNWRERGLEALGKSLRKRFGKRLHLR